MSYVLLERWGGGGEMGYTLNNIDFFHTLEGVATHMNL